MKAIKSVYLGPTNTKPFRIKVSADGVTSKTYDCCSLKGTINSLHIEATLKFCISLGWNTNLAHGQLGPDTWVHCFHRVAGIPALSETDNQKIQAFLDWKNNFLTVEKFAEHYGFTAEEALKIISAGRQLHNKTI